MKLIIFPTQEKLLGAVFVLLFMPKNPLSSDKTVATAVSTPLEQQLALQSLLLRLLQWYLRTACSSPVLLSPQLKRTLIGSSIIKHD